MSHVRGHTRFIDFEKNMRVKQCIVLGILAAMSFAAVAEQAGKETARQASPLDAGAPVAAMRYVSAFNNYQAASEHETSPEQVWRSANEVVGKLAGHASHIDGNAATALMPEPQPAAKAVRISPPGAPAPLHHGNHRH